MFDNKVFEGIQYSRIVASWTNIQGKVDYRFKAFLKNITINDKPIPDEIIKEIYEFGSCGKFELETLAEQFKSDTLLSKADTLRSERAKLTGGDW